jgi:diadenosine tetraphosphate (Ap4A) HIT family hydrolase
MLYHDYLKNMKACSFCEANKRMLIFNEHAYLTYSKAPYHAHHLLVIPKRHVVSFFNLTVKENEDINELVKIGAQILKKLKYDNFSILVREGPKSDKSIKHLHYHLIPNHHIGDLDNKGILRKILSPEEIKKLSVKIVSLAKKIK